MPALPKAPSLVTEWITLPQALRWIVDGTEPDLAGDRGAPPSSPETDAARSDLYRYWISGQLELHGLPGEDATISYDATSSRMEPECDKFGYLEKINKDLIRHEGIDRIDWANGTFYREISGEKESDNCFLFYFCGLRVNREKLYALYTNNKPSRCSQAVLQSPSTEGKRGRGGPKRSDWPLIAALAAIIWEREAENRYSDKGLCDRTARILEVRKNETNGEKYREGPSREGFFREAISAVEQAIKIYPGKNNIILKKRERSKYYRPDILSVASALASITTERNHSEGVDVIDSINIELVKENIALLDNICLDNYYEVPRDKLETLAIENAREAISYYEKWCREHPNFRHNSP
jgi:hypothetical protein